jgi:hypothetical protein
MKGESALEAQIRELEERLLAPEVRASAEELALLLADDFLEFGSSGRTFDKQQVVEALPLEPEARFSIRDFHVRSLAPGVVLATYRAARLKNRTAYSLRSSIWKLADDRWRMTFHQGTPADLP